MEGVEREGRIGFRAAFVLRFTKQTHFPPLMPVLKTLVDLDLKTRFRNLAKAQGLSESECLRGLVLAVTEQDKSTDQQPIQPDPDNSEPDRITVRMPHFLMVSTKVRAKSKGMAPSRFITALLQSNLMAHPVMTDGEIGRLNASTRELASIGRNINQIAKALNDTLNETDRVKLIKLAELQEAILKNRATIRELVKASQNSWGAARLPG